MTDVSGTAAVHMGLVALGGAFTVALGAFALSRRPRAQGPFWFGLFAIAHGAHGIVASALQYLHSPIDVYWYATAPLALAVAIAGAVMPFVFPTRLRADERGYAFAAAAVAAGLLALEIVALWDRPFVRVSRRVFEYSDAAVIPVWLGGIVLFALRYNRTRDALEQRKLALAAAAFTVIAAFTSGYFVIADVRFVSLTVTHRREVFLEIARLVVIALVAVLWLLAIKGRQGRIARNMAWFTLAMTFVGGIVSAMLGRAGSDAGFGLIRVLMALALGYAIFKHQLLGVDAKLRFAISKSTIAAVFIAVFFIASEAAQQFFGETLGSTYVGIAAAGLLVFAMAPLQRAAERLAEKAVPLSTPISSGTPRESAYRAAARRYLRDGKLSREEERELAHLAGEMGIHAGRALEIRHEVEDESSS